MILDRPRNLRWYPILVFLLESLAPPNNIYVFHGSLVGLSGDHVKVRGHIVLEITYNMGSDSKMTEVNYLIIDASSTYDIILGRPTINVLGEIISTWYLALKHQLPDWRVRTIQGDQQSTQIFY